MEYSSSLLPRLVVFCGVNPGLRGIREGSGTMGDERPQIASGTRCVPAGSSECGGYKLSQQESTARSAQLSSANGSLLRAQLSSARPMGVFCAVSSAQLGQWESTAHSAHRISACAPLWVPSTAPADFLSQYQAGGCQARKTPPHLKAVGTHIFLNTESSFLSSPELSGVT